MSLSPDEVKTPFSECTLYSSGVYHLQQDDNFQEGKKH